MIGLEELNRILSLISWWLMTIKSHNAVGFFDINKVAEGFSLKLLNAIYGYSLENLNYNQNNYPGIDLGDEINKIGFQITSRNDARKLQESLKKFSNGASKTYCNGIRFLILSQEKKSRLSKKKYREIYSGFNPDLHILNANDLIQEIRRIYDTDKKKFSCIKNILEEEIAQKAMKKEGDSQKNADNEINYELCLIYNDGTKFVDSQTLFGQVKVILKRIKAYFFNQISLALIEKVTGKILWKRPYYYLTIPEILAIRGSNLLYINNGFMTVRVSSRDLYTGNTVSTGKKIFGYTYNLDCTNKESKIMRNNILIIRSRSKICGILITTGDILWVLKTNKNFSTCAAFNQYIVVIEGDSEKRYNKSNKIKVINIYDGKVLYNSLPEIRVDYSYRKIEMFDYPTFPNIVLSNGSLAYLGKVAGRNIIAFVVHNLETGEVIFKKFFYRVNEMSMYDGGQYIALHAIVSNDYKQRVYIFDLKTQIISWIFDPKCSFREFNPLFSSKDLKELIEVKKVDNDYLYLYRPSVYGSEWIISIRNKKVIKPEELANQDFIGTEEEEHPIHRQLSKLLSWVKKGIAYFLFWFFHTAAVISAFWITALLHDYTGKKEDVLLTFFFWIILIVFVLIARRLLRLSIFEFISEYIDMDID
jgi:hypothetical protein